MTDHLLESLREHRPVALSLLASTFGREATGVAFLILQHRADADEAAARALADAWCLPAEQLAEIDRAGLRTELLGRAAAHALRLRSRSRSVDPLSPTADDQRIRELAPLARAVVALAFAGELRDAAIAAHLEIPAARVAELRAAGAGDVPEGLRRAVRSSLESLPVTVDAEMVRAAMARPPDRPSRRRWILAAAAPAAILVAALVIAGWPRAAPAPSAQGSEPATPGSAREGPAAVQAAVALTPPGFVRAFTLGTCAIRRDLPIEYAGWVDAHLVDPGWTGKDPTFYALVAADANGPIACMYARELGGWVRATLPSDWTPPVAFDGCPTSPVDEYGGYRELGGPGAFVVPSVMPEGWVAGNGSLTRLLVRISPPADIGGTVGATLRSSSSGDLLVGEVNAKPVEPLPTISGKRHASYVWVDGLAVPTPGCWELNVTVGDAVVGAASLPFSGGG
jgi:hypothetical protein